jgi:hypothetical protein
MGQTHILILCSIRTMSRWCGCRSTAQTCLLLRSTIRRCCSLSPSSPASGRTTIMSTVSGGSGTCASDIVAMLRAGPAAKFFWHALPCLVPWTYVAHPTSLKCCFTRRYAGILYSPSRRCSRTSTTRSGCGRHDMASAIWCVGPGRLPKPRLGTCTASSQASNASWDPFIAKACRPCYTLRQCTNGNFGYYSRLFLRKHDLSLILRLSGPD